MKTFTKESTAWKYIARKLEKEKTIRSGLCWEITTLFNRGYIDDSIYSDMYRRVSANRHPKRWEGSFVFKQGKFEERIIAATLLGLQAKEEGR